MTDWREHNGGPQPVGDDVWVETSQRHGLGEDSALAGALDWRHIERSRDIVHFRILNQHLIDAARKDGFEAGLEKSAEVANLEGRQNIPRDDQHLIDAARLEGIRLGLEAAATHLTEGGWIPEIMKLDPDTIAKEADND